jgi:hypothetical protein
MTRVMSPSQSAACQGEGGGQLGWLTMFDLSSGGGGEGTNVNLRAPCVPLVLQDLT